MSNQNIFGDRLLESLGLKYFDDNQSKAENPIPQRDANLRQTLTVSDRDSKESRKMLKITLLTVLSVITSFMMGVAFLSICFTFSSKKDDPLSLIILELRETSKLLKTKDFSGKHVESFRLSIDLTLSATHCIIKSEDKNLILRERIQSIYKNFPKYQIFKYGEHVIKFQFRKSFLFILDKLCSFDSGAFSEKNNNYSAQEERLLILNITSAIAEWELSSKSNFDTYINEMRAMEAIEAYLLRSIETYDLGDSVYITNKATREIFFGNFNKDPFM
ncbi:uncharacterized protein PRCAT00003579001 [Priceomyces carsonii]|uniref:uncharacterized protein n=1 Tax=Priceomyces carsonii TaxID=28549 RepID=UPI002EDA60D3|nr:unnamed protein product [Priceomyces carsonii]